MNKLAIGIVGTGSFAKMHAAKLAKMDGVEIAAFTATSSEKADNVARQHTNARGFCKVEEMLDSCKLDAVYICVPPFAHGQIEEALVERQLPFLVEKPLGVNEETPKRIAESVMHTGLITSVGYHFRYMDSTSKAKTLLENRKLAMATGNWMGDMPGVNWWRAKHLSGGQFVEQTTHIVDLLRYLAGEVDEVYAAYSDRIMSGVEENVQVPDVGSVILKLASGAIATINNTCAIPAGSHADLSLYTNEGVLELNRDHVIDIVEGSRTQYSSLSDPYDKENQAFLHAIKTGDTSNILSTYEDAWQTHRVTMAANESARTGLPVKL